MQGLLALCLLLQKVWCVSQLILSTTNFTHSGLGYTFNDYGLGWSIQYSNNSYVVNSANSLSPPTNLTISLSVFNGTDQNGMYKIVNYATNIDTSLSDLHFQSINGLPSTNSNFLMVNSTNFAYLYQTNSSNLSTLMYVSNVSADCYVFNVSNSLIYGNKATKMVYKISTTSYNLINTLNFSS